MKPAKTDVIAMQISRMNNPAPSQELLILYKINTRGRGVFFSRAFQHVIPNMTEVILVFLSFMSLSFLPEFFKNELYVFPVTNFF